VPKAGAAAGILGVLGAIWWYRTRHTPAAPAAAAAAADPYPPDGSTGDETDPDSTDPATGQTYGDEAGVTGAGGAASIDPYPWDGTTGDAGDPYSMDPQTGATYGDTGTAGTTAPGGPPFSSNAAWSQYAIGYLTGTAGLNARTVTTALGAYLDGKPVTAAQEDIINDAIGIAGKPPVSGPGGFPPSIHVTGTKTGGRTTADNPVKGLKVTAVQKTDATVTWDKEAAATYYTVVVTAGKTTALRQDATGASSHIGGLKPGTAYQVAVTARPARASAAAAHATFRTKTK
jgi:hypothetical protein